MRRLADLSGLLSLKWTQPVPFDDLAFELREVDEVVATLIFRRFPTAIAETAEGSWTFERAGSWPMEVTVLAGDSEVAGLQGSTLSLRDGRAWRTSGDFVTRDLEFRNEKDEPLVTYRCVGGLFRLSCAMAIKPEAAALPELPWLATLGWYLVVLSDFAARGGR